jgi:5-methylcytosine-specific restriction endonuclease McrA
MSLDRIMPITLENIKMCAWCYSSKTKGPKYCSQLCAKSARAHFYPQKEEALNFLLIRQNFQCANCQYDWKPLVLQLLQNGRVYDKPNDYLTQLSYWLIRRIKSKSPENRKPEVDHVIPLFKGGQALGLSNHWCLCYSCHKAKTKVDLSGKRSK